MYMYNYTCIWICHHIYIYMVFFNGIWRLSPVVFVFEINDGPFFEGAAAPSGVPLRSVGVAAEPEVHGVPVERG